MKRFKSWLQQSWALKNTPRREKRSPAFPPPLPLTHLRGSGLRRSSSLAAGGGCGAARAAGGRCGRVAGKLSGAWRQPYTCPSVSVSVRVSARGTPSERRGCAGGAGPGLHLKPPAGSAVPSPAPIPARPVPSHPRPPLGVTGPEAGSPEEESEGRGCGSPPRAPSRAGAGAGFHGWKRRGVPPLPASCEWPWPWPPCASGREKPPLRAGGMRSLGGWHRRGTTAGCPRLLGSLSRSHGRFPAPGNARRFWAKSA